MSTSLLRKAISLLFLFLLIVSPTIGTSEEIIEAGRRVMTKAFSIVVNKSQNEIAQSAAEQFGKSPQDIPSGPIFVVGPISSEGEGSKDMGVAILFPKVADGLRLDAEGVTSLLEENLSQIQSQVATNNEDKFDGVGVATGISDLVITLFYDLSATSQTTPAGTNTSHSSNSKSNAQRPTPKQIAKISYADDGTINSKNFNSKNPPNCKFTRFQKDSLEVHNNLRELHGVPKLILSKQLCDLAKTLLQDKTLRDANGHVQHTKFMKPGNKSGCGENIFWSDNLRHKDDAKKPILAWYNEIGDYFPTKFDKNAAGHFTQVVWKGDRLTQIEDGNEIWEQKDQYLGIDFEEDEYGLHVLAFYYPSGNIYNNTYDFYTRNVLNRTPETGLERISAIMQLYNL